MNIYTKETKERKRELFGEWSVDIEPDIFYFDEKLEKEILILLEKKMMKYIYKPYIPFVVHSYPKKEKFLKDEDILI